LIVNAAVTLDPLYVAVSLVLPDLIPVTRPVLDTVAMVVSVLCQVTSVVTSWTTEALASTTLAANCAVAPTTGGAPVMDNDVIVVDGSVGFDVHAALPAIAPQRRSRRTIEVEVRMGGTCSVDDAFR
jgi:hypothetical protein